MKKHTNYLIAAVIGATAAVVGIYNLSLEEAEEEIVERNCPKASGYDIRIGNLVTRRIMIVGRLRPNALTFDPGCTLTAYDSGWDGTIDHFFLGGTACDRDQLLGALGTRERLSEIQQSVLAKYQK